MLLLGIVGAAALIWVYEWYSGFDGKRIDAIVTPARYAGRAFFQLARRFSSRECRRQPPAFRFTCMTRKRER
jgi:hypothetical protein